MLEQEGEIVNVASLVQQKRNKCKNFANRLLSSLVWQSLLSPEGSKLDVQKKLADGEERDMLFYSPPSFHAPVFP